MGTSEVKEDFSHYDGPDKVISAFELQQKLNNEGKRSWQGKMGFPELDKYIGGIRGGQLIVLTGPSGEGKTLFCQSITSNFAKTGIHSCWFSYEEPPQEFLERFGEDPNERPEFWVPEEIVSRSVNWIRKRSLESKQKYNTKAIFIDHLHYLISMDMAQNTSLVLGAILRDLRQEVAIKYDLVVFIVAHLKKLDFKTQAGNDKEIEVTDTRDSSFVIQEANTAMAIWRVPEASGEFGDKAVVKVGKSRKTGRAGKKFQFVKIGNYLEPAYKDTEIEDDVPF